MLVVALGSIALARAGGPQQGEKLQISEVPTPSPVVVSNLNKLATGESGFKQVKEDLFRPFSSLDPRNSLIDNAMGAPLPMPQRPTMSKRGLELLDKRRNWAFTSYEELFAPQDDVEKKMFGIKEYGADGREKKSMSVVDRYYDSLDNKNLSATNQTAEEARAEFIIQNGFDPLGKTYRVHNASTKGAFQLEAPDTLTDVTGGAVFTGASSSSRLAASTPQELGVQRSKQTELDMLRRSILGDAAIHAGQPGDGINPSLNPYDEASGKNPNSAENLLNQQLSSKAGAKEKSANPFVVVDPTANVLRSHVNDDLTARALGLANPTSSATNSYYNRVTPTAQSIQAEQDPFGANRPKPRF